MAAAAIAFSNKAEATGASLSASGSVALAPVLRLLNPHVGLKWRINATTAYVIIDLGSSVSIDTVMLAGVSGENPGFRVRLSSGDSSGAAGDVFDSGGVLLTGAPNFDPDYGLFVYLRTTPSSGRYLRIDIEEAAVDYIEAGRVFVGLRNAFGINFQAPWSRTPVRGSVDTLGMGGQTFIDLRSGYWKVSCSFGFISETERNSFVEDIGVLIVNSGHLDMLFIRDPESDNLSRDCIWGYPEGDQPVTQDLYVTPPVFSATYPVRERR